MKRVFAHIGFSFALTLIALNFMNIKGAFAVLITASVLFLLSLLFKKTRKAVAIPLCIISCVLASVSFIATYYGSYLPQQSLNGDCVEAEFYIVDIPEKTESGYKYTVETTKINKSKTPQNIKFTLYSTAKINADYCQSVKGKIEFSSIAENGYDSYGAFANGEFLKGYLNDYRIQSGYTKKYLIPVIELREAVISYFNENLSGDNAGIATAFVLGNKNYITDETYSLFKACGIMHVMAVSGLHLSVFVGVIYFVLKKLRVPKTLRVLLTILFTLFYMALVGFTPSVLRAGIMSAIVYLSLLSGDKADTLNSLGFAVFLICLNPYAVTDLGAMLTVSSVLGIVVVYPKFKIKKSSKIKFINYFAESFIMSVSVLITTFPVICMFLGSISLTFTVLNWLVIPIAQIILITAFISLICFPISLLKTAVFFAFKYETNFLLFILKIFSKLSFSVVDISGVYIKLAVGAVFIFIGICIIFKFSNVKLISSICIAMFTVTIAVSAFTERNNTYLKILPGSKSSAVFIYDNEHAFAAGVSSYEQYETIVSTVNNKKLTLNSVVDFNKSEYSRMLCDSCNVINYVANYDLIEYDIYAENVTYAVNSNFAFWQNFTVNYDISQKYKTFVFNVNGFEFVYTNDIVNTSDYDGACYYNAKQNYSVCYTIINDSRFERRQELWQE